MAQPRSTLVCVAQTPWYHIISRCVRRAYLCGQDASSGRCFDHRRGWIVERVKQLSGVFAIDVAAYAVMSNHYHLVVRIDVERAQGWSQEEVLRRWGQLFVGPPALRKLLEGKGAELDAATRQTLEIWTEKYRSRLADLSWFMRVLNESIARKANAEDEVTGHFWEGRFKSQALLDEKAILVAMVYVDLNPVRAQIARTPEESDYTSVAERIRGLEPRQQDASADDDGRCPVVPSAAVPLIGLKCERILGRLPRQVLLPFDATAQLPAAIPFAFEDYLELVDAAGRCMRADKRGRIAENTPVLLQRLGIDPESFIACAGNLMRYFGSAVGSMAKMAELCVVRQVRYLRGMQAARRAFGRRVEPAA